MQKVRTRIQTHPGVGGTREEESPVPQMQERRRQTRHGLRLRDHFQKELRIQAKHQGLSALGRLVSGQCSISNNASRTAFGFETSDLWVWPVIGTKRTGRTACCPNL